MSSRRVLLDALDALYAHRDSTVVIGSHAIYTRFEGASMPIAPFCSNADLLVDPTNLEDSPPIAFALTDTGAAGFTSSPGSWIGQDNVWVNLFVPESFARSTDNGIDLGPHGVGAVRTASGLEASLVDRDVLTVRALEADDDRTCDVMVAGPAALLIAKVHKIAETESRPHLLNPKDAYDMVRIMRATDIDDLASRFSAVLKAPISHDEAVRAAKHLLLMFATKDSLGTALAVTYASPAEPAKSIAASSTSLVHELVSRLSDVL